MAFVENSKTLFQKEYKKELSKYDNIKNKIKKSEDTVLVITSEIEVLKSLIDFHKAVLESLRLFESDTFKINFDSKAIEKNNEDRSLEIMLDGYIKTYNWSAAQLKKASSNFNKNKFDPKKAKSIFGYSILYLFLFFVLFLIDKIL